MPQEKRVPASLTAARLGILGLVLLALVGSARSQVQADDASESERQSAVMMQRFVVAATRIQRNPWRYASVDGIEVLSRASERDSDWWIDALRRGQWLENKVMPAEWLPHPQVPYTVIIDDTDLAAVPTSELHALPLNLHAPDDPLTWDYLSKVTSLSTENIGSYDQDTLALNTNVNGNDTTGFNYGSMTLERLSRNQPPLPRWLLTGLLAENFGIFREGYDLLLGLEEVQPRRIVKAAGPGTLWVSTEETKRMLEMLKKNRHDPKVEIAPLDMLFSESPLREQNLALWQSEAALFGRWGLLGPGRADPALYHAYQELVRRGRTEPITEAVFAQCFGFGYAAMKVRLDAFLQDVIAKPSTVKWDMPSDFLRPLQLKEATSDQIGRILGDWLRMKGNFERESNPELSRELLSAAGRMLERTYREDNGLPPDVEASHGGDASGDTARNNSFGSVTTMRAFVVSAQRIHDPRLLAVYGMYEHDIGDDDKARELLEAATKAEVSRPRAYAVLAQLRYAQAMGAPEGEGSKLSQGQADSILRPLETTLRLDPTSDLFDLFMATWTNCSAKPSAADIREIERGVALYPRNTDLAYNAAVLCAQSGFPEEAAKLIDMGLVFTTHEINREYFEELRKSVGAQSGGAQR
ncbi:MAG TPA: hypothetical protein VIJ19_03940 [Opitutaceae bacterium]